MKVEFENNDTYITESLYQWDLNQELYITGMKVDVAPVFHFSNRKSTESIRVQSYMEEGKITCVIPNQLTKEPYNIIAVAVSYANQKETAEYRIASK